MRGISGRGTLHLIGYRIQPYRRTMFVICSKRLRVITTLVVHHLSRALGLQESPLGISLGGKILNSILQYCE